MWSLLSPPIGQLILSPDWSSQGDSWLVKILNQISQPADLQIKIWHVITGDPPKSPIPHFSLKRNLIPKFFRPKSAPLLLYRIVLVYTGQWIGWSGWGMKLTNKHPWRGWRVWDIHETVHTKFGIEIWFIWWRPFWQESVIRSDTERDRGERLKS